MKTIFKVIVVLAFLATTSLVLAEVYKWVDEKGTVHFTEDPATIPEKYLEKAQSRTMEENSMPIQERIRSKQGREGTAEQKIIIPPKNRYTKDEFERQIIGRTKEEIINTFGNPSSVQASSSRSSDEYWYYRSGTVFLVYDPITEKVFGDIQIIFQYRQVRVGALSTKKDYFAARINY